MYECMLALPEGQEKKIVSTILIQNEILKFAFMEQELKTCLLFFTCALEVENGLLSLPSRLRIMGLRCFPPLYAIQ